MCGFAVLDVRFCASGLGSGLYGFGDVVLLCWMCDQSMIVDLLRRVYFLENRRYFIKKPLPKSVVF